MIEEARMELESKKKLNTTEEAKLTNSYQSVDNQYESGLQDYDTQMRDAENTKQAAQKSFEEENQQLITVRAQW